jgi:hypothetical protein
MKVSPRLNFHVKSNILKSNILKKKLFFRKKFLNHFLSVRLENAAYSEHIADDKIFFGLS